MMLRALMVIIAAAVIGSPVALAQTQRPGAAPPRAPAKKKPKKPVAPPVVIVQPKLPALPPGPLYDETANAQKDISEALSRARNANRRVLIEWGANWSVPCQRLRTVLNSDSNIQRLLQYEYDVVRVNVGQMNVNIDIATSYDARFLDETSVPHFTLLDPDGKPLVNASASRFENDRGEYDAKKVLEFLRGYQPMHQSAETLLNQAYGTAKARGGRPIMLVFGAPLSEASGRMDEWLAAPDVQRTLAQNTVVVRIDIERTLGGHELLHRHTGSWRRNLPWLVFLNSRSGAVIAAGGAKEDADQTFPSQEQDIPRLRDMLSSALNGLKAEDIDALLAFLPPASSVAAASASSDGSGP